MPMVAWYVLSNVSYMNFVIKLVFPTDCSPRNTTFVFFTVVGPADEKSAVPGVPGAAIIEKCYSTEVKGRGRGRGKPRGVLQGRS